LFFILHNGVYVILLNIFLGAGIFLKIMPVKNTGLMLLPL